MFALDANIRLMLVRRPGPLHTDEFEILATTSAFHHIVKPAQKQNGFHTASVHNNSSAPKMSIPNHPFVTTQPYEQIFCHLLQTRPTGQFDPTRQFEFEDHIFRLIDNLKAIAGGEETNYQGFEGFILHAFPQSKPTGNVSPDDFWRICLAADHHFAIAALCPDHPGARRTYPDGLLNALEQSEFVRRNPAAPSVLKLRASWCAAHAMQLMVYVIRATVIYEASMQELAPGVIPGFNASHGDRTRRLMGDFTSNTFESQTAEKIGSLLDEITLPEPVPWPNFHLIHISEAIQRWNAQGVKWR